MQTHTHTNFFTENNSNKSYFSSTFPIHCCNQHRAKVDHLGAATTDGKRQDKQVPS